MACQAWQLGSSGTRRRSRRRRRHQFLSKGRALYGAKIDPERVAFWIEENRLIPTVVSRERRFSKNRALRDRNGSQPVDLGGLVDVEGRKSLHSGAARKVLQIEERVGVMTIETKIGLAGPQAAKDR